MTEQIPAPPAAGDPLGEGWLNHEALREALEIALAQLDVDDAAMRQLAVDEGVAPLGVIAAGAAAAPPAGWPLILRERAPELAGVTRPWLLFEWGTRPLVAIHVSAVAHPADAVGAGE